MKFVFGNTLICSDSYAAKQVTFDKGVKQRTVTLEGDVYDPSGTLSGGSAPSQKPLLNKLNELSAFQIQEKFFKSK